MFGQITEFRFFEKINFSIFRSQKNQLFSSWGVPKKFFRPLYLFWLLNSCFQGGHTSRNCWYEKISKAFFSKKCLLNESSDQQILEVWPPHNHVFRSQKRYRGPKKFLPPNKIKKKVIFWDPKNQKIFFFQKIWILWFDWTLGVVPRVAGVNM